MEQRQCDALGLATDASRMLEKWTKGKHANPSDSARECLRKRVLFSASAKATSYASIFAEKDFIRAEKQCFKFYDQYVRENLGAHCDSEDYNEIGTSLPYLPLWRGIECMSHEMWLMPMSMAPEYKKALELLPLLPSEGEGYTELYTTMQELMQQKTSEFLRTYQSIESAKEGQEIKVIKEKAKAGD